MADLVRRGVPSVAVGGQSIDAFMAVIYPHRPRGRTFGRAASLSRGGGVVRKDHE
jgi:hypothetical protein